VKSNAYDNRLADLLEGYQDTLAGLLFQGKKTAAVPGIVY
jgi:hypothetical protein